MAGSRFDLTGKVALITGGNGGIGLGMAKALAEEGAEIVIWGRDADKNAAAEAEVKAFGKRVLSRVVDVADEQQVEAGMADAISQMGGLHAVFANAAISGAVGPFSEMDMEAYHRVTAVNLDGVVLTLRAAARHMVRRVKAGGPGGSLVAVSSSGALKAAAHHHAYISTKAALHGLIRAIAIEHGQYGIRANVLVPGRIATEINRSMWENPAAAPPGVSQIPLGRWGQPDEMGGAAVYLASDASRFHTGDRLVIDGGATAC